MKFNFFVNGIRVVGDGFGETGTAPTRKGSIAKAAMAKRYILKIEALAATRGARIVGVRQ